MTPCSLPRCPLHTRLQPNRLPGVRVPGREDGLEVTNVTPLAQSLCWDCGHLSSSLRRAHLFLSFPQPMSEQHWCTTTWTTLRGLSLSCLHHCFAPPTPAPEGWIPLCHKGCGPSAPVDAFYICVMAWCETLSLQIKSRFMKRLADLVEIEPWVRDARGAE